MSNEATETVRALKSAIGYIRVSTENQAGDDKYGIESQRNAILDYADKNGYSIVMWKVDEISGVKDDRPAMNDILFGETIMNPPIQAVIAFKSDRIARDMKLYFYYLYVLEKRNIKLLSTEETFDDSNGFAGVYRSLLMFVAEQERRNIALRTTRGRSIKAACGGYSGGRAPFGYKAEGGRLVINEEERPIVEYIFKRHAEKVAMLRISEELNEHGYKTRRGGPFYASNVKSIVDREPFYRGKYKYGGDDAPWVDGVHEPILDNED